MSYTINTAKGAFSAYSLRAVCAWQCEMQGALATITAHGVDVDVDSIDFDGDNLDETVDFVESAMGFALDEERVETLAAEAVAAGDEDMATLCHQLLARSPVAARKVWRAIDRAAAMA